jgi:thiamine biosynthesis lipoprotein
LENIMQKYVVLCLLLLLVACQPAVQPMEPETHLSGKTMGTTYNVKFVTDPNIDNEKLHNEIEQKLININQLMSTYIPDSELSIINKAPANTPMPISAETRLVLEEALRLGQLTDGALNVTLGPLVNLWGFGPDKRPEVIPSDAEIIQAMQSVGLEHIVLNGKQISKRVPGLYIDLSPIAKGYGVDALALLLEAKGITDYLVEIGGEMRLSGIKSSGQEWRVAIEKPLSKQRVIQRIVAIGGNAIATSGDYRNYYEENGVRYSHLIQPQTGYPIQHNLVSVTVIHPSSMTADGLATALSILGTEAAIELAERDNLAVLLISKQGDEFVEYQSPAFATIVKVIK